jgi:inhibitor of cysteine peptidase
MKNFIFRLCIIILLSGLARLVFAQKDFSREFKAIRVPLGKTITIALDAHPATGFSWKLVSISDKSALEFVRKDFSPAEAKMAGAGGVEKWSFKTLKNGQVVIVLEYRRAWEKDTPAAKREEFSIFVK